TLMQLIETCFLHWNFYYAQYNPIEKIPLQNFERDFFDQENAESILDFIGNNPKIILDADTR
ncbi:MAG: hypothetical protein ABI986_12640, partial [Chloroflexota bacterium]